MEVDKHHALAHYISFNATEKNVDTLLPPKRAPAKYSSLATKMQSQGQLLEGQPTITPAELPFSLGRSSSSTRGKLLSLFL